MKDLNQETIDLLIQAMLSLETPKECEAFLNDLLTINELKSLAQRLYVAKLLKDGRSCVDVTGITGASSATVSRVNRSLHYGEDGYVTVLDRLKQENEKGGAVQ